MSDLNNVVLGLNCVASLILLVTWKFYLDERRTFMEMFHSNLIERESLFELKKEHLKIKENMRDEYRDAMLQVERMKEEIKEGKNV